MARTIITLLAVAALSGCATMTPTQKRVAWIAAGVVVAGVAMSLDDEPHTIPGPLCPSNHFNFSTNIGVWVCVE